MPPLKAPWQLLPHITVHLIFFSIYLIVSSMIKLLQAISTKSKTLNQDTCNKAAAVKTPAFRDAVFTFQKGQFARDTEDRGLISPSKAVDCFQRGKSFSSSLRMTSVTQDLQVACIICKSFSKLFLDCKIYQKKKKRYTSCSYSNQKFRSHQIKNTCFTGLALWCRG